jgi:hypothetical protein
VVGLFIVVLAVMAAGIILGVMFAPDEKHEANVVVGGEPLAIEAPSLARPREVEYVGDWDAVDQHWGETQWMMAVG